jgi:hypothetical protein
MTPHVCGCLGEAAVYSTPVEVYGAQGTTKRRLGQHMDEMTMILKLLKHTRTI